MAQPIQRARQALRHADSLASSIRSLLSTSSQDGAQDDLEAQGSASRRQHRRVPSTKASFEGHLGLLFSPESLERDHRTAPRSAMVRVLPRQCMPVLRNTAAARSTVSNTPYPTCKPSLNALLSVVLIADTSAEARRCGSRTERRDSRGCVSFPTLRDGGAE
jgi:hypothetical protein